MSNLKEIIHMAIPGHEHEHICSKCNREVKHYLKECGDPKVIVCAKCLAEAFTNHHLRIREGIR